MLLPLIRLVECNNHNASPIHPKASGRRTRIHVANDGSNDYRSRACRDALHYPESPEPAKVRCGCATKRRYREHRVVRRDGEKLRGELRVLAEIHRIDVLSDAEFFQHNRDLPPVGRGPGV